jgi:hypothetical protein
LVQTKFYWSWAGGPVLFKFSTFFKIYQNKYSEKYIYIPVRIPLISVGGCHMTLTDVSNMSLNDRLATSPGTETKT